MSYKQYSDSYLLKMNKKEIIDLLRVAEHNFFATEEGLQNSARFGAEILAENVELKKLLKLAVDDLNNIGSCKTCVKFEGICRGCRTDYKWVHADEAMKLIGDDVGER